MSLSDWLPDEGIVVQAQAQDWRAAVTASGDALVHVGATTPAYTDEMIGAVEKHGPYIVIAPGVAIAHARPSASVLRGGLSWVSLASPVLFGSQDNDPVDLVIGLAAVDHDGHLAMMSTLALLLADDDALGRLRLATTRAEVRHIFDAATA